MELGSSMTRVCRSCFTLISTLALLQLIQKPVSAGICWTSMNKNGRCEGVISIEQSQEDCCRIGGATVAWTPHVNASSGQIFYWNVLGGGAPDCKPCRGELVQETCSDVQCDPGKRCRMRNGRPKCICAPDCSSHRVRHKGEICGTDGRTYRNHCSMLKYNCRHNSNTEIDYVGSCKRSCSDVECPNRKNCVVDQYGLPHCITCQTQCPDPPSDGSQVVCGGDGNTYESFCHLRRATCLYGSSIGIAYHGRCLGPSTCQDVECPSHMQCLEDRAGGQPQCVQCDPPCMSVGTMRSGRVCGTDNVTYSSWCEMQTTSCVVGVVINTRHSGPCQSTLPSSIEDVYGSTEDEESFHI